MKNERNSLNFFKGILIFTWINAFVILLRGPTSKVSGIEIIHLSGLLMVGIWLVHQFYNKSSLMENNAKLNKIFGL